MALHFRILTLIVISLFATHVQAVQKIAYSNIAPSNKLLGQGVDKDFNLIDKSCLNLTGAYTSEFRYTQDFNFGSNRNKRMNHYLFGDSLSLSLKAIEFDSFFKLHKWDYKTSYQSRIGFEHSYKLGSYLAKTSSIKEGFRKLNGNDFKQTCGSHFVKQYDLEAKFRSDIDIDFFSKRDLYEFEFRLRTDILILKKMVNIIKLKASLFFRFLKSNAKIKINLWQEGGDLIAFKKYYNFLQREGVQFCSPSKPFTVKGALIHTCLSFSRTHFSEASEFKKVWSKILSKVYYYGDVEFRNKLTKENAIVKNLLVTDFSRVNKILPRESITTKKIVKARIDAIQNSLLVKVVNELVEVEKLEEDTSRLTSYQLRHLDKIKNNLKKNLNFLKRLCFDLASCIEQEKMMSRFKIMTIKELDQYPYSFTYTCEQNFNPTKEKQALFYTIFEMIKVAKGRDKELSKMYMKLTKKVDIDSKEEPVNLIDICSKAEEVLRENMTLFFKDKSFTNKKITNINPFLSFSNLKGLDLSGNNISSLEGISFLSSLEKLVLKNNNIGKSYINELIKLKSLKKIDLKWNLLKEFDQQRLLRNNLKMKRKDLKLKNNPGCINDMDCLF